MRHILAAVAATSITITASSAVAATWNLIDVSFEGGYTATGSFEFDGTNYSNMSILLSDGSVFDNIFTFGGSTIADTIGITTSNAVANSAPRFIDLITVGKLVSGIDTLALSSNTALYFCASDSCGPEGLTGLNFGNRAQLVSGSVTQASPVPLPASLPLLALGMGVFGVMRRRRRS